MSRPAAELVVAHYQESLNWLRRVPRAFRVTVYDKGPAPSDAIPLPNHGREAHTYLHHIVERYDALAEVTVFCQGHPFDHVPDLHSTLRRVAAGDLPIRDFLWLGFLIDRDDADGARLFQRWSKNPEQRPLPLTRFFHHLWDEEAPREVVFYGGANFAVTRACMHRKPRAFYERARTLAVDLPDAAHCFERCWDRVFGVNGIPPAHAGAPFPIYLKRIRRLAEGADMAG